MAADPGATAALPDEVKKNLKSIVLELRHLFEGDLDLGLKRLGIDVETGKVTPADEPALSYLTAEERETRSSLDAALAKEAAMTKDVPEAVRALLREAAYTHLNRLIGLKCLELRGHLAIDGERTEIVTQRSDYGDLSKYLWTLRSRDARLLGDPELLWREGLVRACLAASAELGVLFDPADPYAQVWPSHKALVQAVRTLDELPESAFRADELLGWVYQYFQSEEKDRVFAEVRTKKKKIAWADIVPVTQLYTERYMVDFLLQNSIGARWMEMYPDSRAKEAWLYYVEPATPHAREPQAVKEWTLLDPCCGSGHFLVVAFDLLVQLYAEERALAEQGLVPAEWAVPEAEVARTILERNLHGIDIDPRAVQLSALALCLKAKELGLEGTPQMHLVIADCVLQRGENFQTLLDTYRDDQTATEAIEAIWSALEHVRDLGSLVRIEEEVEAAVMKARKRSAGRFDDLFADWGAYKAELISRLRIALVVETSSGDERHRVFGSEAEKGLGLFELLSSRYSVVCTNPPYMGSGNMGPVLKEYIGRHYAPGKPDTFAAFILRNLQLAGNGDYVSMVTQSNWLALRSFATMRLQPQMRNRGREGILAQTAICTMAKLGSGAFGSMTGEVVDVTMFTLRNETPDAEHRLRGVNCSHLRGIEQMTSVLSGSSESFQTRKQALFHSLAEAPIVFWLPEGVMAFLSATEQLGARVVVSQGLGLIHADRFLRFAWEVQPGDQGHEGWAPYVKGGGYGKWFGMDRTVIDWRDKGQSIAREIAERYPYLNDKPAWLIREPERYFQPGLTYTDFSSGNMSCRAMDEAIFSDGGPGVFPEDMPREVVAAYLNSRLVTCLLRATSPGALHMRPGYVRRLPHFESDSETLSMAALACIQLKRQLVEADPTERAFRLTPVPSGAFDSASAERMEQAEYWCLEAWLLSVEGYCESRVQQAVGLSAVDTEYVLRETGMPAGWLPLIPGHDSLPQLSRELPGQRGRLADHLFAHERLELSSRDLEALESRLRKLYVAGPGAKTEAQEGEAAGGASGGGPDGARTPMPPESFLEELSLRLGIHPISVHGMLDQLRAKEGLVCPSEARRETEEWLSVTLLRMLGHRWPVQERYEAEEGKPLLDPAWVDPDGIVALASGLGEETLSERFRRFLDAVFGADKGHDVELELAHVLGWKPGIEWGKQKPLGTGDWFNRDFFKLHASQFKRRPIAWHLKSPKGTVQAIVYYHTFNRDRLALLRARYLGNLHQELGSKLAAATARGYDDRTNVARIDELEEQLADLKAFDDKLSKLQEGRERESRIWCPWKAPEDQPQGWDPDINDGVRVNIAPLQRLGLLASDVLAKKDLESLLAPEGRG